MASWLTSRLKAAEQFLNQIDATAADRAQKAKERVQLGLSSDTEGTESRFGNHFSRTASELSFTDEGVAGGRTPAESGDESSEAGPFMKHINPRPTVSRERNSIKKGGPGATDWTELLRGEKDRPGDGMKLLRTASNVGPAPVRFTRVPKQGSLPSGTTLPQPAPSKKTAGSLSQETEKESKVLAAESSSASAVTAPGKPGELSGVNEDEVVSKRSSIRGSDGKMTAREEQGVPESAVSKGADGQAVAQGILSQVSAGTDNRAEPIRADSGNAPESHLAKSTAYQKRGIVRNNSGVEAVIPTSDSEEGTTIVSSESESENQGSGGGRPEAQGEPVSEAVGETEVQQSRSDFSSPAFEESQAGNQLKPPSKDIGNLAERGASLHSSTTGPIPAVSGLTIEPDRESGTELGGATEATGSKPQQVTESKPHEAIIETIKEKGGLSARDFSIREYNGQDLSVKEVETEGVDSDMQGSESGTDEETDSDTDDSEDERAEMQKQKEEAERQAIERQKAAAAAAALEVTAAETAARAVKEREEVVALLEKEKEELQVEAAEALEKHAKEIARLRASATAGSKAAHVEKSSHSSTRMETYSKEEQLVMENVEKAKALAAAQRTLEGVVAKALEVRRKVEERELHWADLQKQLSEAQQRLRQLQEGPKKEEATTSSLESTVALELEQMAADVERKRQRVVELEERLSAAASQKREPSEREKELERRLQSLTDHLIQKQAQVEALASEKATLALRLETVSSSLQEEEKGDGPFRKRSKQSGRHSASEWWLDDDLEYGSTDMSNRAGRSGRRTGSDSDDEDDEDYKKQKGSFLPGFLVTALQRFDSLTLGGGRILRVNTPARVLLALYLLLLHAWVLLVWSVHSGHALGDVDQVLASALPGVSQAARTVASKSIPAVPTATLPNLRRLSPIFAGMDR